MKSGYVGVGPVSHGPSCDGEEWRRREIVGWRAFRASCTALSNSLEPSFGIVCVAVSWPAVSVQDSASSSSERPAARRVASEFTQNSSSSTGAKLGASGSTNTSQSLHSASKNSGVSTATIEEENVAAVGVEAADDGRGNIGRSGSGYSLSMCRRIATLPAQLVQLSPPPPVHRPLSHLAARPARVDSLQHSASEETHHPR